MKDKYVLGIDTSNYKTSVAVTDQNRNIICDLRRFLKVKQGEKGLRQSDALFQHIKNLPELVEQLMEKEKYEFAAIAYSSRPRPVYGSYMPVFLAGEGYGRTLAAALGIPALAFSHQEGHVEAIKAFSLHSDEKSLLACHFSGGTCELLVTTETSSGYDIQIIGGSKDISFGQVIDRAGVYLGMEFPAGEEMDRLACNAAGGSEVLTPVKVKDAWLNLSGMDTQVKRVLSQRGNEAYEDVVRELFERIAGAMVEMISQGVKKTGIRNILMAGGVASSRFIRASMEGALNAMDIRVVFDDRGLAQDNAVGTALLGGKSIWG